MNLKLSGWIFIWLLTITAAFCQPPGNSRWEKTFEDNFNGNKLDEKKWAWHNGPSSHILSGRYRENIKVGGGLLRLITKIENPKKNGQSWSSAHMWTRNFKQQYGYFECRYRYAAAPGLNNAFWIWTNRTGPEKYRFEIDINEGHYPSEVAMNLHNWTGKHWALPECWFPRDKANLGKNFHTYGLEWNANELIWYFDGKIIRQLKHEICHREVPVFLSTAVMKFLNVSPELDGKSMDVDWVRVYKRIPSAPVLADKQINVSDISCTSVKLNWKNATDDVTPSKKLVYRIYQLKKADSDIRSIESNGRLEAPVIGKTSFSITNLTHDRQYIYTILAVDEAGDKTAFMPVSVNTLSSNDKEPPVAGGQGQLTSENVKKSSFSLKWAKASGDNNIVYRVYISSQNNISKSDEAENNGILKAVVTKPKAEVTGLNSSTPYYVNVIASDSSGNKSTYRTVRVTTDDNLEPPFYSLDFSVPDNPGKDICRNYSDAKIHGTKLITDKTRTGKVLHFDGIKDYISIPALELDKSALTITAWIKCSGAQPSYTGIVFSRKEVAGLTFSVKNQLGYRWPGGASWTWESGLKLESKRWAYVGVAVSPGKARLYLYQDGKLSTAEYQCTNWHSAIPLDSLEIGRDSHGADTKHKRYFKGEIGSVKIYRRALSPEEFLRLK